MASAHTSNHPHGDLRDDDDESILDDDMLEADDGEESSYAIAILVFDYPR